MTDLQPLSGHVSEFKPEVVAGEIPDWPQVRFLVDGNDLFEAVAPSWLGFDPDDILGGSTSPLLPDDDQHRVAVYRCSCGEAGCGVIAPAITLSRDGRYVLWQDFKNYVGVFFRPTTTAANVETVPCRHWNVPDLTFRREEYVAAVAAASQDRSWETPSRQTARLLWEQLSPLNLLLPPDLPLLTVFPAWEGDGLIVRFGLEFDDGTIRQQDLRLTSLDQDPAAAAHDMAARLSSTSPEEWLRVLGDSA